MNTHTFSGGTGEHIHSVEGQVNTHSVEGQVNTHTFSGGTAEHIYIQCRDR